MTAADAYLAKPKAMDDLRKINAQFIENFKHRKTVVALMKAAFAPRLPPSTLHRFLVAQPTIPPMVHAWYDDLPQQALADRTDWATIQGLSQAEHFGQWTRRYGADGTQLDHH